MNLSVWTSNTRTYQLQGHWEEQKSFAAVLEVRKKCTLFKMKICKVNKGYYFPGVKWYDFWQGYRSKWVNLLLQVGVSVKYQIWLRLLAAFPNKPTAVITHHLCLTHVSRGQWWKQKHRKLSSSNNTKVLPFWKEILCLSLSLSAERCSKNRGFCCF